MSYFLGEIAIDDYIEVVINTHDPSDGSELDADSLPTYRIYEENNDTVVTNGNYAKRDDAGTTGCYYFRTQATAVAGFEVGKLYFVRSNATVNSIAGSTIHCFRCVAIGHDAESVADVTDGIATAIGNLENLSAAQAEAACDAALATYDAPTKAELDSAVAPLALEASLIDAAAVEAACDAALATYDPPTKAEMDAAFTTLFADTILNVALPSCVERPESGEPYYLIEVNLKDKEGSMEDPDDNVIALTVYDSGGSSEDTRLYKNRLGGALDTIGAGTFVGWRKLERTAVGQYFCYFKLSSGIATGNLIFKFGREEGGSALYQSRQSVISSGEVSLHVIQVQTDKMHFNGDNILSEIANKGVLNDPAASDVADTVWDELKSEHTGGTSFGDLGQKINQSLSVTESNIRGADADDLKTISDQVDGLNNLSSAQIETACGLALTTYDPPTKAELDSAIAGLNDLSSVEVEAACNASLVSYDPPTKVEMDTGFAGLNDIDLTGVQVACDAALVAYDPPTKTELDAGFAGLNDPTAAIIADAVWNELIADHLGGDKAGQHLENADITADPSAVADAVWDEAVSGHLVVGTFGNFMQFIRAMTKENIVYDEVVRDSNGDLTSMRIRLFATAVLANTATKDGSGEGEFASLTVTGQYASQLLEFGKVVGS